ncbi:unnamed protein product, partial [Prorocentrum cordatum]
DGWWSRQDWQQGSVGSVTSKPEPSVDQILDILAKKGGLGGDVKDLIRRKSRKKKQFAAAKDGIAAAAEVFEQARADHQAEVEIHQRHAKSLEDIDQAVKDAQAKTVFPDIGTKEEPGNPVSDPQFLEMFSKLLDTGTKRFGFEFIDFSKQATAKTTVVNATIREPTPYEGASAAS